MGGQYLIIGSCVVVALIIVIIVLFLIRRANIKYFRNQIKELEIKRNEVASTPVLVELSKVESITKNNDLMGEKCVNWQERFTEIKDKRLGVIDDMLIELDTIIDNRDYENCGYRIAKVQVEIYKIKEAADKLLAEIRNVSSSENRFREEITSLKSRYRVIKENYKSHIDNYGDIAEAIDLQLENIENRFIDFEKIMTRTDYDEAVKLLDALEQMINHIEIVVNEMPDIIRISNKVLPDTINEVEETYKSMTEKGYSLEYLNIEYNIAESKKNIDNITQKVKLLNLEDCKFELENMLEFFQSLFIDFEKERLSKKAYLQELNGFKIKLEKVNEQCNSVFNEMDNIKSTYNLSEKDLNDINEANKLLIMINDDYKKLSLKDESNATPYSLLFDELEVLSNRLNDMDDDFNKTLKSLGNMYDDEERAREQLTEIEDFLQQSRKLIYSYKLPVITEEYFIQLEEANEAIGEVINELEKKPIEIKVLNTRVDTARDLVLKLYNTTRELIKNAKMAEASIVYGNRYRSFYKEIDKGLNTAEKEFYNGNYKLSLDTSTKAIGLVDKDITSKLEELYGK